MNWIERKFLSGRFQSSSLWRWGALTLSWQRNATVDWGTTAEEEKFINDPQKRNEMFSWFFWKLPASHVKGIGSSNLNKTVTHVTLDIKRGVRHWWYYEMIKNNDDGKWNSFSYYFLERKDLINKKNWNSLNFSPRHDKCAWTWHFSLDCN